MCIKIKRAHCPVPTKARCTVASHSMTLQLTFTYVQPQKQTEHDAAWSWVDCSRPEVPGVRSTVPSSRRAITARQSMHLLWLKACESASPP